MLWKLLPNLIHGWIKVELDQRQQKKNKLENHLLSLRAEHQKRIWPNLHPSYNAYHEKLVELIISTLETYTTNIKTHQNEDQEEVIIDNILNKLDKKRTMVINKKKGLYSKMKCWSMH